MANKAAFQGVCTNSKEISTNTAVRTIPVIHLSVPPVPHSVSANHTAALLSISGRMTRYVPRTTRYARLHNVLPQFPTQIRCLRNARPLKGLHCAGGAGAVAGHKGEGRPIVPG